MTNVTTVDLGFLVNTERLPAMPGVALEVIRQTESDEIDLEKIAETVGRDPALAGRLLKLSNSPLFGRSQEVTSINQALMVLGLKAVKMAAISFSMNAALGAGAEANGLGREEDYQGFWRRSVTSAVAARQLVNAREPGLADEAFLCGLLQDIGFAAMLRTTHEPYREVLPSIDAGHPALAAERWALEDHTHTDVSAVVLQSWDLSPILVMPVQYHHDLEAIPEDAPEEVMVLARALNLAHDVATILNSEESRGAALATAREKAREWYGMDSDALTVFIDDLAGHAQLMGDVMEVDMGSPEEMALMMMRAQEDLIAFAVGTDRELQSTRTRVEELRARAETDALTGIKNRAAFDELIAEHWSDRITGDNETPVGLIMADVDRFKRLNDRYGHQAGDEVLRHVARALEGACREEREIVCRYGGEEFVIIVTGTGCDDLLEVAERFRVAIDSMKVPLDQGSLSVTASFGGSWLCSIPSGVTARRLLEDADRNLYEAKEAGRNRCVVRAFEDA